MDYAHRIDKLARLLDDEKCEAMAFVPGPNFFYLTGVDLALMERPTFLVVTSDARIHAMIPALERDRWAAHMPQARTVYWQDAEGYENAIGQLAAGLKVKALAVEGNRMRQFEAQALSRGFAFDVVDGTAIVKPLRLSKDPVEIEAIRHAIAVSEAALTATVSQIEAGMSETDIRARLVIEMLMRGADGPGFDPIVLVGGAAADCHGIPSAERILKPGDALLFDFGAKVDGYSADITRTFFCQHVSDAHRRFYDAVLEANRIGCSMVAPGVSANDLDKAVLAHFENAGYAANIRHKLGHGLGLDIHEAPQLMVGNHEELAPGMVITIEPGLYEPGALGVRIEDDVLVTETGASILTQLPRELTFVG